MYFWRKRRQISITWKKNPGKPKIFSLVSGWQNNHLENSSIRYKSISSNKHWQLEIHIKSDSFKKTSLIHFFYKFNLNTTLYFTYSNIVYTWNSTVIKWFDIWFWKLDFFLNSTDSAIGSRHTQSLSMIDCLFDPLEFLLEFVLGWGSLWYDKKFSFLSINFQSEN